MKFTNVIKQWFEKEGGGSLFLPDGWYGRPYDGQHDLTYLSESDDNLVLTLSQKLNLHFSGLKSVKVKDRELIFGPFSKLRFEWKSFGTDVATGVKEYQSGEVKIVPTPGK